MLPRAEWGGAAHQIFPSDILTLSVDLERRIKQGLGKINVALRAAHAMVSLVTAQAAAMGGIDLRRAPASFRKPALRNQQISRVLSYGDEWEKDLDALGRNLEGAGVPRLEDTVTATDNFKNRVIRPNRPVLHLAIGLAVALDVRSKQLAAEMGAQETWERAGYVTYRVGAGEDPRPLPMVTIDRVLREPKIAMRAVLVSKRWERRRRLCRPRPISGRHRFTCA